MNQAVAATNSRGEDDALLLADSLSVKIKKSSTSRKLYILCYVLIATRTREEDMWRLFKVKIVVAVLLFSTLTLSGCGIFHPWCHSHHSSDCEHHH